MILYGFEILRNDNPSFSLSNEKYKKIKINYYKTPFLNTYTENKEHIQHYFLNDRTIIYNNIGQLLEITSDSIAFYSKEDVQKEDLDYIMYTSAIPYLMRFNNRIALHGTAITYKNEAIILLGTSGSWKSTLSYALTKTLHEKILSDDLIAISDDNQYVFKGQLKVRLFEKNYLTINHLYNDKKDNYYVSKSDDKISVNFFEEDNLLNEYKIRKIYILNNTRMNSENFIDTKFTIEKKNNIFLELFQNIKCWQSINGINISTEINKLQKLAKNDFIRVVSFNSVNNDIERNISEVVASITKDVLKGD